MRSIAEQLELVKRSLEKSLAELEKIHEAELSMRELEKTEQSGSEECK